LERQYTFIDQVCLGFDQFLRALGGAPQTTGRAYPAGKEKDADLTPAEKKHAAGLMRVNHAGEICAQALYHGQALASHGSGTGEKLRQAAIEEGDHLAWCSRRLTELDSHISYLNPFWYLGSFCIGLSAGVAGDRWSLGFVAETEKQVVKHLQGHLEQLPEKDEKSRHILQQMQRDEEKHRQEAVHLGAATLPRLVQTGMTWVSRVMVKLAYYI
jgi:ubiquinone biosynthesis monooxygenase Coq7